jgi:hypothetical protein
MASILLIGTDAALLEGLAQTLGAAGHRTSLAASFADAASRSPGDPPLLLVVERELALVAGGGQSAELLRTVPLAPGGAVVLFRHGGAGGDGRTDAGEGALPPALRRTTLAELTLPLERHRLVALAQTVEERARRAGRARMPASPEHRAP